MNRFTDEFWTEHWPWLQRPLVYFDPRGLSLDKNVTASLHAKCIIVDDEIAFVTSANFTEWACAGLLRIPASRSWTPRSRICGYPSDQLKTTALFTISGFSRTSSGGSESCKFDYSGF